MTSADDLRFADAVRALLEKPTWKILTHEIGPITQTEAVLGSKVIGFQYDTKNIGDEKYKQLRASLAQSMAQSIALEKDVSQ